MKCLESLTQEKAIQRSPWGKKVHTVISQILTINRQKLVATAVVVITKVYSCINVGKQHRLPSTSQSYVWKAFHAMRTSDEMSSIWNAFVTHNSIAHDESQLLLQLLMDRLLKALIKNEGRRVPSTSNTPTLNQREQNAVRYMAGYVAVALLKKYKRPTKKEALQKKHNFFVQVFSQMKASHQPGDVDSLADYTRSWSDLIDRGGLYHIGDEVARLFEAIEMVVRRHLEVTHVSSQSNDVNYKSAITRELGEDC